MKKVKAKIARAYARVDKLQEELKEIQRNLDIPCGCGELHKIKDCVAIQTHWYTSPYSCSGGDYWNEGELQILCPVEGVANRYLTTDEKLEKRFKSTYKSLFKSITDQYQDKVPTWNNKFLDKYADYYGLAEDK